MKKELINKKIYNLTKKILFKIDPETTHNIFITLGELLGSNLLTRKIASAVFNYQHKKLNQKILGVSFENPVGLAAGFDYDANLTQILPQVGFGFMTIGTITNIPYEGNKKPRLGRLIKSKSLLVNKGFKNSGIDEVLKKLKNKKFEIPLGISVGKSNVPEIDTQEKAIKDITSAFIKVEKSKIPFSYYELNISCPNLSGKVSFYPTENLRELLSKVTSIKLSKPVFIKMPLGKSDEEIVTMLNVIKRFEIAGVIFSNLSKDRNNPTLVQEEVAKCGKGSFSGLPAQKRSTELIKLTKQKFKDRFVIIGCGGIFSAEDAYEKIKAGASLVQLITGMIYEGPGLISEINHGLVDSLKRDGFSNISDAVGKNSYLD